MQVIFIMPWLPSENIRLKQPQCGGIREILRSTYFCTILINLNLRWDNHFWMFVKSTALLVHWILFLWKSQEQQCVLNNKSILCWPSMYEGSVASSLLPSWNDIQYVSYGVELYLWEGHHLLPSAPCFHHEAAKVSYGDSRSAVLFVSNPCM